MSVSEAWACSVQVSQISQAGFLTGGPMSFGNCKQMSVSMCIFLSRESTAFIKFPKEAMYLLWLHRPNTPPHVWQQTHRAGTRLGLGTSLH